MRLEQRPGNIPLSKRQSGSTISLDAKGGPKDLGPACRKFEGFLLGELFKEMREAESSSRGIIPVSRAERIFVRQQCETLGDLMAQREPLGLARLLRPQITGKQSAGGGARTRPTRTGETTDAH